jgi:hypothetical protein
MKMLPLLSGAALLLGVTVANAADPFVLTNTQLDSVTAGEATASLSLTGTASGPAKASVTGTGEATVNTVGGLSPSNTATLKGTLSVSSS